MHRRALRIRTAAVLASCATVALVGCSANAPTDDTAALLDPSTRGAAWQAEAFSELYAQEIEWFECGPDEGLDDATAEELAGVGVDLDEVGCAAVLAPLDWNDPENSETIELSIVHIPSTGSDEPIGTLTGNPGGPGATGVDFMLGMPLSPGFEGVLESYDLLGFDPRGIGGSTPLDCDDITSDIVAVQIAECGERSPLVHTMGTVQVARDMELLRHLIGADRLDYLGYSYGTMLGATYASIFPDEVGRMVLDSAENAAWASPIHLFDQQVAAANAMVALATACRTEYADEVEVCPFTSEESLLAVIAELNATPLVASDGTEITGEVLRGYLWDALYSSTFERGRTLDTIALALFGDQGAIDGIGEAAAGGAGLDLAFTVVTCHSFPIEPDVTGLLAHIEETGVPKLLGGPELTDEVLAPFLDLSCYALPESGLDYTETFDAAGAGPILVIGITGDHATPFQYAQVLADELGDATLLTLDGQGHAASYTGRSSCIDDAVTRYLLDGRLPKAGTVCTDD